MTVSAVRACNNVAREQEPARQIAGPPIGADAATSTGPLLRPRATESAGYADADAGGADGEFGVGRKIADHIQLGLQ